MRFFTRIVVCLAVLALCAACLNAAASWFGEETSVLRLARLLVFETRRSQAMDVRSEMVVRSLDLKHGITAQLIAGRLQLREAIDEFQQANEIIVNGNRSLLATYQLPADREGVGRQVLTWAYCTAGSQPSSKAQRRLADLESEYQKLFGRPSPLDPSQTADPLPNACCAG